MTNRPRGQRRRRSQKSTSAQGPDSRLALGAIQGLLIGSGVVVAVAGFWLLSTGSISAAPALLLLAYLLLIPVGLALPRLSRRSSKKDDAG